MTILGPCRCQGCGQLVVLERDRGRLRWIHDSGNGCRNHKPDTERRAYWRTMKARSRARMAAGVAGARGR